MSQIVLTDCFVSIDGNDISDHVKSASLPYGAVSLDDTAMGDDTESHAGGLKTWSVQLEALQDFAASDLDSILFPLVGTTFTVIIRPDNTDGVGSGNPNFTGTGMLEGYDPFGGSNVGDLVTTSPSIVSAGTLSRNTS